MKPLIADMHMHTLMSGHAFGTVREMAAQAAEQNMRLIGIAEHGPGIPGTCDPIYFRNIGDAPRSLYGVELLYGCEINILQDGTLKLDERTMGYLDYAIAGVHRQCYDDAGAVKNTDAMIRSMQYPCVRFISHPDNGKYPLYYPALVEAAKEYGIALEVNNASIRKPKLRPNCIENYEVMIPLCIEHGVPLIVNTDAHDPLAVGDFTLATRLLERLEVPDDLILNNDVEKVKAFLLKK